MAHNNPFFIRLTLDIFVLDSSPPSTVNCKPAMIPGKNIDISMYKTTHKAELFIYRFNSDNIIFDFLKEI